MTYFLLFFLEIGLLFFLSRIVSKTLSRFLSIHVLSFLFLPGIIVHELSHLLVSGILFVRAGDIEFTPKITDKGLKLGSVEIARTDPVRRSIIGFAPVFVGISIIIGIVYLFSSNLVLFRENLYGVALMTLGAGYILFAISNSMFSSKKDMEGTLELVIALIVIFTVLYLIGLRMPSYFVEYLFRPEVLRLIQKSSLFLLAPIIIDVLILGAIKLFSTNRR